MGYANNLNRFLLLCHRLGWFDEYWVKNFEITSMSLDWDLKQKQLIPCSFLSHVSCVSFPVCLSVHLNHLLLCPLSFRTEKSSICLKPLVSLPRFPCWHSLAAFPSLWLKPINQPFSVKITQWLGRSIFDSALRYEKNPNNWVIFNPGLLKVYR